MCLNQQTSAALGQKCTGDSIGYMLNPEVYLYFRRYHFESVHAQGYRCCESSVEEVLIEMLYMVGVSIRFI